MKFKDSYVVLDLDHTLINTETSSTPNPLLEKNCDFHFKLQGIHYYVFKRPGVDKFIDVLTKNFKGIAVWTAAVSTYAKQIIKGVFGIKHIPKLVFIWTRNQTQSDEKGLYKALSKLWSDPSLNKTLNPNNTVHVDNTESVMRHNPQQALLVPDFFYYKINNRIEQKHPKQQKQLQQQKQKEQIIAKKNGLDLVFNTSDNYLIYLTTLINDIHKKNNKNELKDLISKGNLLTKWYEN